jgi:hypothetical protein
MASTMTIRSALIACLLFFAAAPALAGDIRSPDGQLIARIVIAKSKTTRGSLIEIKTKAGKLLLKKIYLFGNGEFGYLVDQSSWTPNSKFFVYSLYSAEGHQPWHSPIDIYVRKSNALKSLEDGGLLAIDPHFAVTAPNTIEIFGKTDRQDSEESTFPIDLSAYE